MQNELREKQEAVMELPKKQRKAMKVSHSFTTNSPNILTVSSDLL